MNKVKVSVCISVHNTSHLLPRCLDSVCAQTLNDLEIVLVNNGSTDNSEEIMRQYERLHPERKFVIYSQEDRGLAQGRQSGINNASGEYIAFLDADDYVEPTIYEEMLKCAEDNNVDIVEIETWREGKVLSSPYKGLYQSHDILKNYLKNGVLCSMLWLRLYKRDLFNKSVLPNLYTNNEDSFALPCLLYAAKSIYFLKKPLHTYSTDNEQGVMHLYMTDLSYAEKFFKSRKVALSCFVHFRKFVGEEWINNNIELYNCFLSKGICTFLFTNFMGKPKSIKEECIKEIFGFSSNKEISHFLKSYLPFMPNTYGIVKILGYNCAYKLLMH